MFGFQIFDLEGWNSAQNIRAFEFSIMKNPCAEMLLKTASYEARNLDVSVIVSQIILLGEGVFLLLER